MTCFEKTNKATLSKDIEKMGSYVENILPRCACIIDAMSFVQKTIGNHKTFAQVAKELFLTVMNEGKGCSRIAIIFDVYKSLSIKNAERLKRGQGDAPIFTQILPGHNIKQWARFLKDSTN